MAITITQQPNLDSHFSAFHPLPIKCTSNRANIVNIKAVVREGNTGTAIATIRKPYDIGTINSFTIDIFSIVQSLVSYDLPLFGIHSQCTNSYKYIYLSLEEEYLSGGILVTGSNVSTNKFNVHNCAINRLETTATDFSSTILSFDNGEARIPIGLEDSYYIQAIKTGNFDHLQVTVYYSNNTFNTFNDTIGWSDDERWNISCGPFYIINALGANSDIVKYTVGIADVGNVIVSNILTFVIDNSCSIDPFKLTYLNQRGAFNTFTFKTKLVFKESVKKELWSKRKEVGVGYSLSSNTPEVGLFKDETISKYEIESQPIHSAFMDELREILYAKAVFLTLYQGYTATFGPDVVINGTFNTIAGWTTSVSLLGTLSYAGNKVTFYDPVADSIALVEQPGILTIGETYRVTAHVTNNNGVQITANGNLLANPNQNGVLSVDFNANSTGISFEFSNGPSTGGVHFDNVTIYAIRNYQLSVYLPMLIDDGEYTVADNRKRENKLSFSAIFANKNYNGIG